MDEQADTVAATEHRQRGGRGAKDFHAIYGRRAVGNTLRRVGGIAEGF